MDHLENCYLRLNARTCHARMTERTEHSLVCLVEIEKEDTERVCRVLAIMRLLF